MCYANSTGTGQSFWGKLVSNRVTDPLQLWNKHADVVDPLRLTGAQAYNDQLKAAKAAKNQPALSTYDKPIAAPSAAAGYKAGNPSTTQTLLTGSPNTNQRTLIG